MLVQQSSRGARRRWGDATAVQVHWSWRRTRRRWDDAPAVQVHRSWRMVPRRWGTLGAAAYRFRSGRVAVGATPPRRCCAARGEGRVAGGATPPPCWRNSRGGGRVASGATPPRCWCTSRDGGRVATEATPPRWWFTVRGEGCVAGGATPRGPGPLVLAQGASPCGNSAARSHRTSRWADRLFVNCEVYFRSPPGTVGPCVSRKSLYLFLCGDTACT